MPRNQIKEIENGWAKQLKEITLAGINKEEVADFLTADWTDEKLRAKAREVWREFAVHGIYHFDRRTGQFKLLPFTDLDGKVSLGLLKMAGFDVSKITYVPPGEFVPRATNIDTGGQSGFVIDKETRTAFLDHHGEKSTRASIATAKLIYRVLAATNFLKREPALDALTKFVTQVDNQTHPDLRKPETFENSNRTILGLWHFLTFETTLGYFKSGRSPTEILSDEDLEKYNLVQASKTQRGIINQSKEKIKELEQRGFAIETRFGRMLIDIHRQVSAGQSAALAYGYNGYCSYTPETKSFFIGISKGNLDVNFSQGKLVRRCLWIKPRDQEELKVSLKEIISQLTDKDFKPTGKLKVFLDKLERKEAAKNIYIVTPKRTYNQRTGQYDWTTAELGKFAIFPFDFQPKPGVKYRVTIYEDTAPGEKRGVLWLKVLGEAEEEK